MPLCGVRLTLSLGLAVVKYKRLSLSMSGMETFKEVGPMHTPANSGGLLCLRQSGALGRVP